MTYNYKPPTGNVSMTRRDLQDEFRRWNMTTATRPPALSDRQQAILAYVRDYWREHRYSPSFREIQIGCGISSTSVVAYNLRALQGKGLITVPPGSWSEGWQTRGIVPVGGVCPCCGRGE